MGFLNDDQEQVFYWLAQPVVFKGCSGLWIVINVTAKNRRITLTVKEIDGGRELVIPSTDCRVVGFRRLARRYAPISSPMASCNLILNESKRKRNTLRTAMKCQSREDRLGFKESVNRRKKRQERLNQEFNESLQKEPKPRSKQR